MPFPVSFGCGEPQRLQLASRFLLLFCLILLGSAMHPVSAQKLLALNLPPAPTPAIAFSSSLGPAGYGVMLPPPAAAKPRSSRWRSPMALSLYALAGGEAFDMYETHRVLSHPQWLCGYNAQLSGEMIATTDPKTAPASVAQVCAPSTAGQTPNYAFQGSFQEGGWTSELRLAGPRNFSGVLGWNIGLDASEVAVPFLLRHRMPSRTTLVPALTNFAHAAAHFYGGLYNREFLSGSAGSPNTYFNYAPQLNPVFPGPRWWGRQ